MSQYDMYDNILPLILRLFDNEQLLEFPWKVWMESGKWKVHWKVYIFLFLLQVPYARKTWFEKI